MAKAKRIIKKLRAIIPDMECLDGCHDCCGPVIMSEWEQAQIKIMPMTGCQYSKLDCLYLDNSGCSIYEDRPIICRLFGTTEKLLCPHGIKPGKLLTRQEVRIINTELRKIMDSEAMLKKVGRLIKEIRPDG